MFRALFTMLLLGITPLLVAAVPTFDIIPEFASLDKKEGFQKNVALFSKVFDSKIPPEGYRLLITPDATQLFYSTETGLSYAKLTLRQLRHFNEGKLPCAEIIDSPRYPYRGLMLDVAHHFLTVNEICSFIDTMYNYKFNKLHLHLTDDQGWRIALEKWPKLETIASKRDETENDQTPHGGFYTKEDLKQINKYAKKRHIQVIPEVDMPGHSQALLSAYPEFSCFPDTSLKVKTRGGISNQLVCHADTRIWFFYDDLFNHLIEIFPGTEIHLGGGECQEKGWEQCKKCMQLRKDKNLKNTKEQMSAFFKKASDLLVKKDGKPIFWYENKSFNYPKNSIVQAWRGGLTPKAIRETREKEVKIICSPREFTYLNLKQHPQGHAKGHINTLENCYQFDPSYGFPEEEQKHVLGLEGILWSEKLPSFRSVSLKAYPRAFALAEAAWTPMNRRDSEHFFKKVKRHELHPLPRIN